MNDALDAFKTVSSETTLVSEIQKIVDENTIVLAPGQGKTPVSFLYNEHCEELAFPHFSPSGKFGYRVKRQVTISPFRYFDQYLLNFMQNLHLKQIIIFFVSSAVGQSHLK